MRKTIRNVTMVVPVLMTSCHVSLKPKRGPVTAQTMMVPAAMAKARGGAAARAVHLAKFVNHVVDFDGLIYLLRWPQYITKRRPRVFYPHKTRAKQVILGGDENKTRRRLQL